MYYIIVSQSTNPNTVEKQSCKKRLLAKYESLDNANAEFDSVMNKTCDMWPEAWFYIFSICKIEGNHKTTF